MTQQESNNCESNKPRSILITEYKIELPELIRKKHGVAKLEGQIPHLLPPGEHKHIDMENLQVEEDILTEWFVSRGLLEKDSKYYYKFKDNFAHHAFCTIAPGPSAELVRCMSFFLGWTFLHDDIIDNLNDMRHSSVEGGITTVKNSNAVFRDILMDKYGRDDKGKKFPENALPLFQPLCQTLRDMHAFFHKTISNYGTRNGYFLSTFFEYFDTLDMIAFENINERFSEETMKYWLRLVTGLKIEFELVWLIQNVNVPEVLRNDLLFQRVLMGSQDVAEGINGAMGIAKDLVNNEMDTWTMHKLLVKNTPLVEAYRQAMEYQNEESRDMRNLIELLRNRYKGTPEYPDVDKTFRGIEDFLDGYIKWCSTCTRYLSKTTVSHKIIME